jgi:IrrE N-terminal-like domain
MRQDVTAKYEDPRAHAVRERYVTLFGGPQLPVPVEAIASDLLGLRVEEAWDIDCSGMLLPAERRIVLNAAEGAGGRNDPPLRRFRFTIAHEIGHWVCHCLEGRAPSPAPAYCREVDLTEAADRTLEREANVFAAELLMPEPAVRAAWDELAGVGACAARFDVSPTAMQWRLHSYGLADMPNREGGQ